MEVEWRRKGLGGDGGGDDCRTGRGVGGFEGVEEDQFFLLLVDYYIARTRRGWRKRRRRRMRMRRERDGALLSADHLET